MLTSVPHDYPRPNNKKRSLGLDAESHWTKRTKQQHSSTITSWTQPISATPFPQFQQQQQQQLQQQQQQQQQQQHQYRLSPLTGSPGNTMTNDTVKKESVDIMMVDDMGPSCYSERIDDMEKYLNDEDNDVKDESSKTIEGHPIDIYAILERHHRPLTVTMVNGVLLPMERQHGGTKHCIPEFVLRSSNSTTCKSNLGTQVNYISMDQAQQTQPFMLGNNDSMDID